MLAADTPVEFPGMDSFDERYEGTLAELIDTLAEVRATVVLAPDTILTPTRLIRHVAPSNLAAHYSESMGGRSFDASDAEHEQPIVSLAYGFSVFHCYRRWVAGEESSNEKPAWESHDAFVEVTRTPAGDAQLFGDLVMAFLFELSATTRVNYRPKKFLGLPHPEDWFVEVDEDVLHEIYEGTPPKLLPPVAGVDLSTAYEHFGLAEDDSIPASYRVIEHAKVLEYVSATVIRLEAHDRLRTKLRNSRVLAPDAAYLDQLVRIVEDQRIFRKDAEAIRLTVSRTCDEDELWSVLPEYLKARARQSPSEGAEHFAKCLSATRNQVAHAKASYEPTKLEAPEDGLNDLLRAARLASVHAVRWLAALPTHLRFG